jgi:tRNA G18 (ribose-2'-O)-methylase SpoU
MDDTRNVIDEFKGMPESEIIQALDNRNHDLVVALENTERDFSMGTIVRSANAFGVRHVYVIGRRQWNKRGAMMTDKYLHITYHATQDDFMMATQGRALIAFDNVPGCVNLSQTTLPKNAVLLFGAEGPGISDALLQKADKIVAIEQFGSTRSINVGVAAGVVMYEWLRQRKL